jgi:hypothetical protein
MLLQLIHSIRQVLQRAFLIALDSIVLGLGVRHAIWLIDARGL